MTELRYFDKDVVSEEVDRFYDGVSPETLCRTISNYLEKTPENKRVTFKLEFNVEEEYDGYNTAVLVLSKLRKLTEEEIENRKKMRLAEIKLRIRDMEETLEKLKEEEK